MWYVVHYDQGALCRHNIRLMMSGDYFRVCGYSSGTIDIDARSYISGYFALFRSCTLSMVLVVGSYSTVIPDSFTPDIAQTIQDASLLWNWHLRQRLRNIYRSEIIVAICNTMMGKWHTVGLQEATRFTSNDHLRRPVRSPALGGSWIFALKPGAA